MNTNTAAHDTVEFKPVDTPRTLDEITADAPQLLSPELLHHVVGGGPGGSWVEGPGGSW